MSDHNTWIGRKEKALGIQSKVHNEWRNAIDLLNCKYFDRLWGGIDPERVDVHFVNWYVNNLVRLVYFRDPYIFVKPRDMDGNFQAFSETMEEVINYYWRELGLKQQFKKTILSAFVTPPGWIKIGYTAKIGEDIANIDGIKQKTLIQSLKDTIKGVFKKEDEQTPEEKGVLDLNIKEESIFSAWIPSWNVLLAPGYHQVDKMPYIIEWEDVSMVDFQANPQYKNKDQAKATREITEKKDSGMLQKPSYVHDGAKGEEDENRVIRLYHGWDRREQKRVTFSDKAIHFEGDWPYDMEGFPLKPLIFEETLPLQDESNAYPVNAIAPIFPLIIEQSNSRTMMSKHRKRSNSIILVQKGIYTEEEINQLEENESIQIIQVTSIDACKPFSPPPLPPDVYNIDSVVKQDLQMATQMGQMMFQAMPGQRTATQAQLAQGGLQLGAQARVDVVEDFTVMIARSMGQLAWQFLDREKVAEIIGKPVTPNMWPNLPKDKRERRRIIQAELSFRIDAGSTAPPKDETVERKQWLDAISIVANIAPERIKKDEAVKAALKPFKIYMKDVDKIVISSDEEELIAAQEENQLLAGGVPQVVGPNENHMLHVKTHVQIPPNKVSDLHISEHGKFLGMSGQQAQSGDKRPPTKSTNPEIVRKGIQNQGDINSSTQNLGAGTGPEAK